MTLNKTIDNIKKSKLSFFNLKKDSYLNFDLYREGISSIYKCYDNDRNYIIYCRFIVNKKNHKKFGHCYKMPIFSIDIESLVTPDFVYLPINFINYEELMYDDIWIPKLAK